jgi:hypothetical protein
MTSGCLPAEGVRLDQGPDIMLVLISVLGRNEISPAALFRSELLPEIGEYLQMVLLHVRQSQQHPPQSVIRRQIRNG